MSLAFILTHFPKDNIIQIAKLCLIFFRPTLQELRRRFVANGSSSTAFSVNPGFISSDIYRFIPKLVRPVVIMVVRLTGNNVDEGCRTSVCTSALPLKSLSGERGAASVIR